MVRLHVLTAASMKMFSGMCGLVEIDERSRGDHHPDDGGSNHLRNVVNFYQTTRRNIPAESPSASPLTSSFV
jgi:hypothetical protein